MEGHLLYSKFTDLNINSIFKKKNTFTPTSRLAFDHVSGYCSPATLIHKIHHLGLVATHLDDGWSLGPCSGLTLPLTAWPGSRGLTSSQVSSVSCIRPPDLISTLGFCDQPLTPQAGPPGLLSAALPQSSSVAVELAGPTHVPGNHKCPENGNIKDSSVTLISHWAMVAWLSFWSPWQQWGAVSQGSLGIWGGQQPHIHPTGIFPH